jgi:hypothetical protein
MEGLERARLEKEGVKGLFFVYALSKKHLGLQCQCHL